MNAKIFFSLLSLLILFTNELYASEFSVEINTYFKSVIPTSEVRFILNVPKPGKQIMAIEYVFTNPSKYETVTFNTYKKEEIAPFENNSRHLTTFFKKTKLI